MRWRALRPVGEPLPPIRDGLDPAQVLPAGYAAYFVQSGTAALALALLAAKSNFGAARRTVLLPAYGCPDLVAAVEYAGLAPEVVDTAPGEPFMDLELLEARLDEDVAAVVAVHFLGLPERVEAVRRLAGKVGAAVIEDSAQRLPGSGGLGPDADLVVLSFGRGKPAGALGGGLLLVRQGTLDGLDLAQWISAAAGAAIPAAWQRLAYNVAIRPLPYALASRLPGLGIGETHYRPLGAIEALAPGPRRVAMTTLATPGDPPALSVQQQWYKAIRALPSATNLAATADAVNRFALTRFPVLLRSRELRDAAHQRLDSAGLGSSTMYRAALPDVPGVRVGTSGNVAAAREFAGRLLTLPLHSDVRPQDVGRIEQILREQCR